MDGKTDNIPEGLAVKDRDTDADVSGDNDDDDNDDDDDNEFGNNGDGDFDNGDTNVEDCGDSDVVEGADGEGELATAVDCTTDLSLELYVTDPNALKSMHFVSGLAEVV